MRLYRTAAGAWAGTQADAGKGFQLVDVPTDKPGLIAWLNQHQAGATEAPPADELALPAPAPPAPALDAAALIASGERRARTAHDITIEEAIAAADLPRTIRLCEHVHWRLKEHLDAARGAA